MSLPKRLAKWLPQLRAAETLFGVDYLLLAALVDRESLGGDALSPPGPAGCGDGGHGRGLAQIDDRAHPTLAQALLCSGCRLLENPTFNLLVAAEYLASLLRDFDGVVEWPELPAVAAYNAGQSRVRKALRQAGGPLTHAQLLQVLDALTTGGDYVSNVLARRKSFAVIAEPKRKA